jgi:hypothetical protein
MKWTVTLVAETEPGHVTEHPLVNRTGIVGEQVV